MPSFSFNIDITVAKTSGKFVSKDEIGEQIMEYLDNVQNDIDLTFDEGEYEITDFTVDEVTTIKPKKK